MIDQLRKRFHFKLQLAGFSLSNLNSLDSSSLNLKAHFAELQTRAQAQARALIVVDGRWKLGVVQTV